MTKSEIWVVIMIAFGSGFLVGAITVKSDIRKQAVEAGHAEYHQTTGDWQWKEIGE